jgi:hypothetical protein
VFVRTHVRAHVCSCVLPPAQLSSLGVAAENINFRAVTAESEKFITVREQPAGGQPTVVIIDMANPTNPTRRQISADSALMSWNRKVIALKAGENLQVFDLDSKQKLKAHAMAEVRLPTCFSHLLFTRSKRRRSSMPHASAIDTAHGNRMWVCFTRAHSPWSFGSGSAPPCWAW